MTIKINFDVDKIAAEFKEFAYELTNDLKSAVKKLSIETRGRVENRVQSELKSSRNTYLDNFGWTEVSDDIFVIYLDEPALWIEEGIEANKDMKPDLLNGKSTRVIPFKYGNPPQDNAHFTQDMVNKVKSELQKNKIPFKKIEYDKNGSPRVGKLHELNISSPIPGRGNTPALSRLSIYQRKNEKTGQIRRDILTFRTVTNGPASAGKWIHPGAPAKKYMDQSVEWAMQQWETVILPEITDKWK